MCGIIGYLGKGKTFNVLLAGLKRLEYRGYDSFGFATIDEKGNAVLVKDVGKISEKVNSDILAKKLNGNFGIAHTRWATTGKVSLNNAHPHCDCKKEIFVVHNGIIENYKELKESLIKEGHKFYSETDTEVLAHLIEKYFTKNLEDAVRRALREVRGAYAILVISTRDFPKIIGARVSSPLILGIDKNNFILASDPNAIVSYTRQVIEIEDNEMAVVTPEGFFILKEKPTVRLEWDSQEIQKKGYAHFMLKEIMEEPETIKNAIKGRIVLSEGLAKLGGLERVEEKLKNIDNLHLVGCGTSFFAGLVGKYMLEEYAEIETNAEIASEFRYQKIVSGRSSDGAIFISQSGETADTLGALREAKRKGILSIGITNVVGSSQARESDAGVYLRAGPEIAVASTKAFVSQLSIFSLLTVYLGRQRKMSLVTGKRILKELEALPDFAKEILKKSEEIKNIAQRYNKFKNFIFIGRKYNLATALEGALKLKEISYLHSEGVAGGELKHGPLALINEEIPTIAICLSDSVYEKMVLNIEEVKTRKGKVIAIATEGNKEIKKIADDVIYIPKTLEMLSPILAVIPLHLLAYHLSVSLGIDPDKPRNLAKSVTVE